MTAPKPDAGDLAKSIIGEPPDRSGERPSARRPAIEIGSTPETIRALAEALSDNVIPGIYVTDGRPVHVEEISGTASSRVSGDEDAPLPVAAAPLTPASLSLLLADKTFTYRIQSRKGSGKGETFEEEVTPVANALAAVLARRTWPTIPPLLGIVGTPVLRPDGSLLQTPGYDPKTGLYLASKIGLDPVPPRPTAQQVAEARSFIWDRLLLDFPWVSPADKANQLGLMVTPILRPYTRALSPFGIVSATMPGSGKTILTACIGMLQGQRVLSWTHSDEELRKSITSVLADQAGAIVFDNLHEGAVIDSPILARLITERVWADRLLGRNTTASIPNDRLWLATGNNLNVGGDMASRSVLVQLDPDTPHPEARTGFAIEHLDQWILDPARQRQVLWALLVLIVDWTVNGAEKADVRAMRQFTAWAQAVGGLLAHHGIPDFLANAAVVHAVDEAAAEWMPFLTRWHELLGQDWLTAAEVRKRADDHFGWPGGADPWRGTFPTDVRGVPVSAKALGVRLRGQVGRWRGEYVLRKSRDKNTNSGVYRVEKKE
jgi:hypothetical protein